MTSPERQTGTSVEVENPERMAAKGFINQDRAPGTVLSFPDSDGAEKNE